MYVDLQFCEIVESRLQQRRYDRLVSNLALVRLAFPSSPPSLSPVFFALIFLPFFLPPPSYRYYRFRLRPTDNDGQMPKYLQGPCPDRINDALSRKSCFN